MEELELAKKREYMVRKANELIQKASNNLGYIEQKVFCYIVSMIRQGDEPTTVYTFTINDYCEICGINKNNGQTIKAVKDSFDKLCDTFFIEIEPGKHRTARWIDNAIIDTGNGTISATFHPLISKYLFGIDGCFTQYHLLSILPMKSTYSIKIYELLKSYSGYAKTGKHIQEFELTELKKKLGVITVDSKTKAEQDKYKNFKDFRRKVLEMATEEINQYTDINISWQPITKGRKVIKVSFTISKKKSWEALTSQFKANDKLRGE